MVGHEHAVSVRPNVPFEWYGIIWCIPVFHEASHEFCATAAIGSGDFIQAENLKRRVFALTCAAHRRRVATGVSNDDDRDAATPQIQQPMFNLIAPVIGAIFFDPTKQACNVVED